MSALELLEKRPRRCRCGRLAGISLAGEQGLALVADLLGGALVALRDAVLAGFALSDGFHPSGTACEAVGSAKARSSFSKNLRALNAAIGIPVEIVIGLVDTHVTENRWSVNDILRHCGNFRTEPDACGQDVPQTIVRSPAVCASCGP